jgi:hypothetical protein
VATRQGLDASIVNRFGSRQQAYFLQLKLRFDTDNIRVWSGTDDLVIGGSDLYTGAGSLLSIGNVQKKI